MARLRARIIRHRLAVFFALAYGISWAIWTPAVLVYVGREDKALTAGLLLAGLAGAYGPSIAAIVMLSLEGGRREVVANLRRFLDWRIGAAWYAVVLGLFPAMLIAALGVYAVTGGVLGAFDGSRIAAIIAGAFLFALPFGPLGEELGWRGYALPRMQDRWTALTSSVVLGVLWTFWHVPLFWIPGAALGPETPVNAGTVGMYLVSVIGTAIVFTWVFNNTGGSLLAAVLLHAMTNASGQIIFPLFPDMTVEGTERVVLYAVGIKWAVAGIVVAVFGGAELRRKGAERKLLTGVRGKIGSD